MGLPHKTLTDGPDCYGLNLRRDTPNTQALLLYQTWSRFIQANHSRSHRSQRFSVELPVALFEFLEILC